MHATPSIMCMLDYVLHASLLVCLPCRNCNLESDAVYVLARQFLNLRYLYIAGGEWLDASVLDVLLSEAVQGYKLRISMWEEASQVHEYKVYMPVGC
jgi:hypothetical protein